MTRLSEYFPIHVLNSIYRYGAMVLSMLVIQTETAGSATPMSERRDDESSIAWTLC